MNYMYIYYLFIYLFIYLIIHLLISYLFIFVDDAIAHPPSPFHLSMRGNSYQIVVNGSGSL